MAIKLHWYARPVARKSPVGRWLHGLGPSWSASPIRRLVQAGCFALFMALFLYVAWPHGSGDFAEVRSRKEWIDIELFLALDPLVSLTAAMAARAWVWSLWFAAAILGIGLVLPRAFCGYVCPMGTLIDMTDWALCRRIQRFHVHRPGWWRNLRYFVLICVLAAAAGGVVLSGYVAAIPVLTRGFMFILAPLDTGLLHGWENVPPMGATQLVSIGLFGIILLLGLLRPRFWCRHVCPSGAVFSVFNLLRVTERKTKSHCIECGKCAKHCSFDAINDDFTTLAANCAFCQTCGGVCPVDAIEFSGRFVPLIPAPLAPVPTLAPANPRVSKSQGHPVTELSRRNFLLGAATGVAAGGVAAAGLKLPSIAAPSVLRPPGSTPEDLFARLCVRCGQCLRVCPSGILQPLGIEQGLDRLWTPWANADWAGCEPTCNNCGQVCPTGAIQALTLAQKKQTRMGLAEVDADTCLQCQGRSDCETAEGASLLCRDACEAAGYGAIDSSGEGHSIPSVQSDLCVGCGLCQAECYRAFVTEKRLLKKAAIRVNPSGISVQVGGMNPSATSPAPTTVDVPYSDPGD